MLTLADPGAALLARAGAVLAPLGGRGPVLLAISGGADSMALLHLAARWRAAADAAGPAAPLFCVATVDHGLRPEAALEARGVGAAAAMLGLSHTILTWTGDTPRTRLQERARNARYALLAQEARARGCAVVATAHHADDQAETTLMRLTRGSGPAGLAGMSVRAPMPGAADLTLARPLLETPKEALIAVCRAVGQRFVTDTSNDDPRYRRAALRALAPMLAQEGLDRAALLRLARRAARAEAALARFTGERIDAARLGDGADARRFCRVALAGLPQEALVRLVGREVAALSGAAPRLAKVERLTDDLGAALTHGTLWRGALGGVIVRLGAAALVLERAPPRRVAAPATP